MWDSISKWLLPVIVFIASSPTFADAASCVYAWPKLFTRSCSTAQDEWPIAANKKGHFIYYEVAPYNDYKVIDMDTNVTLRQGTAGLSKKHETIFGLYGNRYTVIVKGNVAGWAYINNN